MCKPTNKPNGKPQYYVLECPPDNIQFLIEHGKNCDKPIVELSIQNVETIRRQFLHTATPTGKFRRQGDLVAGLLAEFKRYNAEVLPLYPSDNPEDANYGSFDDYDMAKDEFLESLWDVISQHFTDKSDVEEN